MYVIQNKIGTTPFYLSALTNSDNVFGPNFTCSKKDAVKFHSKEQAESIIVRLNRPPLGSVLTTEYFYEETPN